MAIELQAEELKRLTLDCCCWIDVKESWYVPRRRTGGLDLLENDERDEF